MKTVIEMAREAGIRDCTCNGTLGCLERFAELIRADEREACAKGVDAAKAGEEDWDSNDWNQAVEFCASRIRARSNT